MAGMSKRTYLREVNPHLVCPLCRGYLIDATTVVECLHSFCRSCILKHLRVESHCPSCKHLMNQAKPNIKADKALQDIVYKLVPGLYHREMRKRRDFYSKHPEYAESATPEQRGEDVSGRLIFAPEDAVSLSLEYLQPGIDPLVILSCNSDTEMQNHANAPKCKTNGDAITNGDGTGRRYLQCPALVTIAHLKKFLGLKYNVDMTRYNIEICHRRAPLPEHWTLMDVAYIYAWKRNAPMRFFYRIMQEEQRLEAPPHDRPSTPGLGASLPPSEDSSERKENSDYKYKPSKESSSKSRITHENSTKESNADKSESKHSVSKDNKRNMDHPQDKVKLVKSPIKILKNPDGRYEVIRSPTSVRSEDHKTHEHKTHEHKSSHEHKTSHEHKVTSNVKSSPPAEFSVVSIGDNPNSNGVKITLKQCSPGTTKKPKTVSGLTKPEKGNTEKDEVYKEKQKRKVTFTEESSEVKTKKPAEQQDKKQFLQGFRLTAKSRNEKDSKEVSDDKSSKIETDKTNEESKKKSDLKLKFTNPIPDLKSVSNDSNKIDVYTFPGDPPQPLPPGAVKRKCPPGLPIAEIVRKKQQQYCQKKPLPPSAGGVKCYRNKVTKPQPIQPKPPTVIPSGSASNIPPKPSPMLSNDTRNLLDGCGLNIPASLSITLTAPKSPNHSDQSEPPKDSQNKVNPSITLNDKSVDPRVLKALKSGQMRMPMPVMKPRARQDRDSSQPPAKRKKEDILDLSGSKKDVHPLRIPQPVSKFKSKSSTVRDVPTTNHAHSQVVTLMGGQRYYRAPPGSLTPAAHRVADIPTPTRAPVYAPCLSSPVSSSRNSTLFPNLHSLYSLGQPNIQFPMDSRLRLSPKETQPKSHLAAQCAPVKPARFSVGSLPVPIIKPSSLSPMLNKVTGSDTKSANGETTLEKQSSCSQSVSEGSVGQSTAAPSQANFERNVSPAITEERRNQQGAASPRVSSTASPSPPPIESTHSKSITEAIKSPESPDSSSAVTETPNTDAKDVRVEEKPQDESKSVKDQDLKKPLLSGDFQKRFFAAFPTNEWANNSVTPEHVGNFLKNFKSMQGRSGPKEPEKLNGGKPKDENLTKSNRKVVEN